MKGTMKIKKPAIMKAGSKKQKKIKPKQFKASKTPVRAPARVAPEQARINPKTVEESPGWDEAYEFLCVLYKGLELV